MPENITDSVKRVTFYFGRTVGTADGEKIWKAIELYSHYLHGVVSQEPLLLTPPAISNLSGTSIDISEWYGISLNNPVFQLGTQTVPFNEANAGATTGATTVAAGRERWVVIFARWTSVGATETQDTNGFPVDAEDHHAVEYRIIMGTDFVAGTNPGPPSDWQTEIDAGSIPLAAVLIQNASHEVYPLYTQRRILDDLTRHSEAMSLVPPGTFINDLSDPRDTLPVINVIDDGGTYYAELDNTNDWIANLNGTLLDNKIQANLTTFRSETPIVGGEILRLKISDVWPYRPIIYVTDLTGYPTTTGDSYVATPATLVGTEGDPGAFPTTVKDIVLGYTQAGTPPVVTEVASPPENEVYEFTVVPDYSTGLGAAAAALDSTLSLPFPIGRDTVVSYTFDKFDASGVAPVNRDVPHQMYVSKRYTNFESVGISSRGNWLDTSSGLAQAATNKHFKPGCTVTVTLKPPTSKV